ncbi:MAG TPA: hypothetical protein VFU05_06510 [Cyclobacteriaceae bacterium]|nr:hypothetical protein [Cyclobacteriaceae bacterium]
MKKIIIITGVLVALCATSLCAQTKEQSAGFTRKFSDASNVRWEKITADVSLARFAQANAISLAYFNQRGELLLIGKQIDLNQSPESVQKSLAALAKAQEKKEGALHVIHFYQLTQDNVTKFYANMGNENIYLAVMVTMGGRATIVKKSKVNTKGFTGPVIAAF